jgi:hypothetical protein
MCRPSDERGRQRGVLAGAAWVFARESAVRTLAALGEAARPPGVRSGLAVTAALGGRPAVLRGSALTEPGAAAGELRVRVLLFAEGLRLTAEVRLPASGPARVRLEGEPGWTPQPAGAGVCRVRRAPGDLPPPAAPEGEWAARQAELHTAAAEAVLSPGRCWAEAVADAALRAGVVPHAPLCRDLSPCASLLSWRCGTRATGLLVCCQRAHEAWADGAAELLDTVGWAGEARAAAVLAVCAPACGAAGGVAAAGQLCAVEAAIERVAGVVPLYAAYLRGGQDFALHRHSLVGEELCAAGAALDRLLRVWALGAGGRVRFPPAACRSPVPGAIGRALQVPAAVHTARGPGGAAACHVLLQAQPLLAVELPVRTRAAWPEALLFLAGCVRQARLQRLPLLVRFAAAAGAGVPRAPMLGWLEAALADDGARARVLHLPAGCCLPLPVFRLLATAGGFAVLADPRARVASGPVRVPASRFAGGQRVTACWPRELRNALLGEL